MGQRYFLEFSRYIMNTNMLYSYKHRPPLFDIGITVLLYTYLNFIDLGFFITVTMQLCPAFVY